MLKRLSCASQRFVGFVRNTGLMTSDGVWSGKKQIGIARRSEKQPAIHRLDLVSRHHHPGSFVDLSS